MRIVHMTSVHPWHDTRIFVKMCRSLARQGHDVHLVAPRKGATGTTVLEGITVHAVSAGGSRLRRMGRTVAEVLRLAAATEADLYHFHDPEFLPRARGFQARTKRPLVYDVHEDVRVQVRAKAWIPGWARGPAGRAAGWFEDHVAPQMAAVVVATPGIRERFERHPRCVVVQNFPTLDEFPSDAALEEERQAGLFAYVGAIAGIRGAIEMVTALAHCANGVTLALAGEWESESLRTECRHMAAWRRVEERGFLHRPDVTALLRAAQGGLVVLHPRPNYVDAYPVKMFEYMAAGLPVIASDFPLWRSIIDGAGCGLLVDPLDPKAIARAMRWIMDHPEEARAMGRRGRRAVLERYNWECEVAKLFRLYEELTHKPVIRIPPLRAAG